MQTVQTEVVRPKKEGFWVGEIFQEREFVSGPRSGFCDVGLNASQLVRRPEVDCDWHLWATLEDSVQLRGVRHPIPLRQSDVSARGAIHIKPLFPLRMTKRLQRRPRAILQPSLVQGTCAAAAQMKRASVSQTLGTEVRIRPAPPSAHLQHWARSPRCIMNNIED